MNRSRMLQSFLSQPFFPYPTDGLVSYWRLDEDPAIHNTVIEDSFGSNNGTLITNDGSTNKSVIGKVDRAVDFDGSNDFVELPNDFMSGFTAWSVVGWVRTPATFTDNMSPFLGSLSTSTYPTIRYKTDDQKWQCYAGDGSFFVNAVRSSSVVLPDTWYHITMTYNGTSFVLYIDASDNTDGGTVAIGGVLGEDTSTGGVRIGGVSAGASRRAWGGIIDDVLIYNRALTLAEIQQIYNFGA